jgi:hypothetical protein
VTGTDLTQLLAESRTMKRTAWLRKLRKWARKLSKSRK